MANGAVGINAKQKVEVSGLYYHLPVVHVPVLTNISVFGDILYRVLEA